MIFPILPYLRLGKLRDIIPQKNNIIFYKNDLKNYIVNILYNMTVETATEKTIAVIAGLQSNIDRIKPHYVGVDTLSKVNNLFELRYENKPVRPFIDIDTDDTVFDDENHFNEVDEVILSILQNHENFTSYSILHASHFKAVDCRYNPKTKQTEIYKIKPKLSYRLTDPTLICKDMEELKTYIQEGVEPVLRDALGEYMDYVKIDYGVYSKGKFSCVNSYKFPQQKERIKKLVKGDIEDTFIHTFNGKEQELEIEYHDETENDEEEEKQPEPEPKKVILKPKPKPLPKTVTKTKSKTQIKDDNYSLQDKHVELLMKYMKNPDTIQMKDYINVGLVLKNNDYPLKLFYDWGQLNDIWKKENAEDAPVRWDIFHTRHYPFEVIYKICKTHAPEQWKEWKLKYLSSKNTIPLADLKKGENAVMKHILPEIRTKIKYFGKRFYILNENNLWEKSENCSYELITTIHKYIDNSITKLQLDLDKDDIDEDTKKKIREERNEYITYYKKTNASSFISHIEKQLKTVLHDPVFYEKLDSTDGIIAFKNGVYDLELGHLRDIFASDLLTETLDFNYQQSSEEDRQAIKQDLIKICNNNPQHLEYYLSIIGHSFTGLADKEKALYFMIGEGGNNGKTSFFEALVDILPLYAHKTGNELIEKRSKDQHKFLAEMKGKRFVYCDELDKKQKLNEIMLKMLGEGSSIRYKVMHGTTARLLTKFKLFMITNHDPQFTTDGGLSNRSRVLKFDSNFDKDCKEDDYDNCRFCVDKHINNRWRGEHKHAIIDLIFEYAKAYYDDGFKLKPYPDEYQKETDELLLQNDTVRLNFLKYFEIHPDGKADGRDVLYKLGAENHKDIKGDMARFGGFKYDSQLYVGMKTTNENTPFEKKVKIKGGYKGFRLKKDTDEDDDCEEDLLI